MTPALVLLKRERISHKVLEYDHDPNHPSYGMEAVEKLGLEATQVFKTLVVQLDGGKLAVAVVPVSTTLNLKLAAKALGAKKAAMAPVADVERSSGYLLGGVSPLGQKKALMTAIDDSAATMGRIYVSAGRRGLEVALAPADLLRLTRGRFAPLSS